MPSPVSHRSLLSAAQRALGATQLAWLRSGRVEEDFHTCAGQLFSEQGMAYLDEARKDRSYSAAEAPLVARQLAYLAAQDVLLSGRRAIAQLLAAPIPLGHATELPRELFMLLLSDVGGEANGAPRDRALCTALEPMALRWVEQRVRSASVFSERLDALVRQRPAVEAVTLDPREPRGVARPASAPIAHDPAARWLDTTEDATREMVRWLTRSAAQGGSPTWSMLFAALRAPHFDGLARPARRFFRLAAGARRLGFERELTTRMRAEPSRTLLAPRACVVALSVPDDIRVLQPSIEYGVVSDLAATQSTGEALALALVSSAQTELTRLPCAWGVSAAIGTLLLQLRAEPGYLCRVDGISPDVAERLARHAAIFVLLRTRLDAALSLIEQGVFRSDRDRLEHLSMLAERAFGCAVPGGLAALMFFATAPQGSDFEAADCGLALHAALRERFDDDWFLNPRVGEVIRGACVRGNLLTARELCSELAAGNELGAARALEILG